MYVADENVALPAAAGSGYSDVIKDLRPDLSKEARTIGFQFQASAVTGTNIDVALCGSLKADGSTPFLLKDALVADITDDTLVSGVVDLNEYPAPYYLIRYTVDVDESLNTITAKIFG